MRGAVSGIMATGVTSWPSTSFRQVDQAEIGVLPHAVEYDPTPVRRDVEGVDGRRAREPRELTAFHRDQIEQPEIVITARPQQVDEPLAARKKAEVAAAAGWNPNDGKRHRTAIGTHRLHRRSRGLLPFVDDQVSVR